jgi:hypothetical protein
MQRSRFFCLLMALFIIPFRIYAQNSDYRPNLIPPSPDASALGKYGECSIGLFVGMIPTTVPIFSVEDGNLQVPINFSYYPSGNKVDEAASFAGLGFTLNAGGAIMRSVKNLPDDYPVKGFLDYSATYSQSYLENDPNRYTQWLDIAGGCADAEPDAYFFNFGGFTGAFSFDPYRNVDIRAKNDWRVEVLKTDSNNPKRITGWKFTGDDGVIYTFAAAEQATIIDDGFPCQAGIVYNSAWYLTNITSPNGGRSINFTYETYSMNFNVNHSVTQRVFCYANPAGCQTTLPPVTNLTQMTYSGQRIKTITTSDNGTSVTFNYLTTRTDEPGTNLKQLDEIVINNKDNVLFRKYTMGYDYSTGRLTLKSVKKTGTDEPPYQFDYASPALPPRTTNGNPPAALGQDHWGYFNGKTTNTTMLPPIWKPDPNSSALVYYQGGDRNTDFTATGAGMLKKITYPAGGTDEFNYEPNTYGFVGHQSMGDLGQYQLTNSPKSVIVQATATSNTFPQLNSFEQIISGLGEDMVQVKITFMGSKVGSGPVTIDISDDGTDPGTSFYYKRTFTSYQSPEVSSFTYVKLPKDGKYLIRASAQGYQSHNNPDGSVTTQASHAYIKLDWTSGTASAFPIKYKNTGGVRIASARSFSHPGDPLAIVREFLYNNADGTSSGSIIEEPSYNINNLKYYTSSEAACTYDLRIAQNNAALGYGPLVTYGTVTELSGSGGSNGKTVYTYGQDGGGFSHLPPFQLIPPSSSSDEAMMSSYHVYKRVDKVFQIVSEVSNDITAMGGFNGTGNYDGIKISFDGGANTPTKFHSAYYRIMHGFWHPFYLDKKEYSSDGTSYVETITQNAYFHQHLANQKITYGNSTDYYDEIDYFYPSEFTNPTTAIQSMVNKNINATPLEIIRKRVKGTTTLYTGADLKTYALDASSRIYPSTVQTLQLTQPATSYTAAYSGAAGTADPRFVTVKTFDKFDAKENLSQFTGKDGVTTSFLWDKHNNNPVVEAIGVAADKVAWSGFENTTPSNFGGTWGLVGSYVTTDFATGKQCYNGTVTVNTAGFLNQNYNLSFWMKGSTPFVLNGTTSIPVTTNWTLYETKITGGTSVTINTQGGLIDEVRIYPVTTQMTTYGFDQLVGVNTITDAKSKATFYESDNLGRLHLMKDQNRDIVKRVNYEYDILTPLGYTLTATQTGDYTYLFQVVGGSAGYTFEWDFDDQNTPTTTTATSITHTFSPLTVKYSMKVKVKNSVNTLATLSTDVLVTKQGGSTIVCNESDFNISLLSVARTYNFQATTVTGANYTWDMGNGAVLFGSNCQQVYTPGDYKIELTTSVAGKSCSTSKNITVK